MSPGRYYKDPVEEECNLSRTITRVRTPTPPWRPRTPHPPEDMSKESIHQPVAMAWEYGNSQVQSTSASVDMDRRFHRSPGHSEAKRRPAEPRKNQDPKDRRSHKSTQENRRQTSPEQRKERSTGYKGSTNYETRSHKTSKSTDYSHKSDD